MFPDKNSLDDIKNLQAFKAEITLRFAMPINVLSFSIFLLGFILNLKFDRVENISRTVKILSLIVFLQILSIISSNVSIKFENMHHVNFFPSVFSIIFSIFFLLKSRKIFYDLKSNYSKISYKRKYLFISDYFFIFLFTIHFY